MSSKTDAVGNGGALEKIVDVLVRFRAKSNGYPVLTMWADIVAYFVELLLRHRPISFYMRDTIFRR